MMVGIAVNEVGGKAGYIPEHLPQPGNTCTGLVPLVPVIILSLSHFINYFDHLLPLASFNLRSY
jgi:hypothetical protein